MKVCQNLLAAILLISVATISWAQNVESIELSDGSRLEGYIASQSTSDGVIFATECAFINIPSSDIAEMSPLPQPYDGLSPQWQAWLDAHDGKQLSTLRLVGRNSGRARSASGASSTSKSQPSEWKYDMNFDTVCVLVKGDIVTVFCIEQASVSLPWSAIKCQTRRPLPREARYGIEEEITMRDKRVYRGNIVRQEPGKSVHLLSANGVVEVLSMKDIAVVSKVCREDDASYFVQTPLLDVVDYNTHTADKVATVSGFIIEQKLTEVDGRAPMLTIVTLDHEYTDIPYVDILQTRHVPNPDYIADGEIPDLQNGETAINGQLATEVTLQNKNGLVTTSDLTNVIEISADNLEDNLITVEMNSTTRRMDDFRLAQLTDMSERAKKNNIQQMGFTFESLLVGDGGRAHSVSDVGGNITVGKFRVEEGWYMLYHTVHRIGYLVHIQ